LNQSEPNLILTAHATKLNRPEPNWTEPQTCLAGRNHAFRPKFGRPGPIGIKFCYLFNGRTSFWPITL